VVVGARSSSPTRGATVEREVHGHEPVGARERRREFVDRCDDGDRDLRFGFERRDDRPLRRRRRAASR